MLRSREYRSTQRAFVKFHPYFRDFGFLDSPPARARTVTGTSTIRARWRSPSMRISDVQNWSCSRTSFFSVSTRAARYPLDTSVTRCPVIRETSREKNRMPKWRTWLSFSNSPSTREPWTMSASPLTMGATTSGSSAGTCWPSASIDATMVAPSCRAIS
jgi:hypothetical protein